MPALLFPHLYFLLSVPDSLTSPNNKSRLFSYSYTLIIRCAPSFVRCIPFSSQSSVSAPGPLRNSLHPWRLAPRCSPPRSVCYTTDGASFASCTPDPTFILRRNPRTRSDIATVVSISNPITRTIGIHVPPFRDHHGKNKNSHR